MARRASSPSRLATAPTSVEQCPLWALVCQSHLPRCVVKSVDELVEYARGYAHLLEQDMRWQRGERGGGWWTAGPDFRVQHHRFPRCGRVGVPAQYSGDDSHWTRRTTAIYEDHGDGRSAESGARAVGQFLRSWADQVEAGVIEVLGAQAQAEIARVNTDVMGQVRRLIEDRQTHPAAPIVLRGVALETALRATVEAHSLVLSERPSMSAYGRLLRASNLISAQDMKDIDQCGGLRNTAAHGEFDALSAERAGLLEQQTTLLLRRLGDLSR